MIKFSELSETSIQEFAGSVIFKRGSNYYHDDRVEDFWYDPEKGEMSAAIEGNFGKYHIEICNKDDKAEARCDCPFDGYPCKHIVAVLLYYIHNKETYLKEALSQRKTDNGIRERLSALAKDELIEIIVSSLKKYPTFKRGILVRLSIDTENIQKQFFKEVDKIFRKFDKGRFSTHEISRDFKAIIKEIEHADPEIRIETIWKITDGILYELNEYGMDDEPLEDLVLENFELLVNLLHEHPDLVELKRKISKKLNDFYEKGNCGIVDDIHEAAYELSDEEA